MQFSESRSLTYINLRNTVVDVMSYTLYGFRMLAPCAKCLQFRHSPLGAQLMKGCDALRSYSGKI
ncbi:protein of unknown function [Hyphomicrobium sp. MC1]|nr:protein of unknown function [Hyphomicrobium sp. MC1]